MIIYLCYHFQISLLSYRWLSMRMELFFGTTLLRNNLSVFLCAYFWEVGKRKLETWILLISNAFKKIQLPVLLHYLTLGKYLWISVSTWSREGSKKLWLKPVLNLSANFIPKITDSLHSQLNGLCPIWISVLMSDQ